MKLTYHWEGEYLIPDLEPPESPQIGIWGERRRQFLRISQRPLYNAMFMSGTLNAYLEEVDRRAEEMLERLIKQLSMHENITEDLKDADQIQWARLMRGIYDRAAEIVKHDLIFH